MIISKKFKLNKFCTIESFLLTTSNSNHQIFHLIATLDKVIKCEELGAYMAINYNEEDFVDKIWKDTMKLNEPG